jgi:hypothetical protein
MRFSPPARMTRLVAILVLPLLLTATIISAAPPRPPGDHLTTIALPAAALVLPAGFTTEAPHADPLRDKLDSAVLALAVAARASAAAASELATAQAIARSGDHVQVELVTHPEDIQNARAAVAAAGGSVTGVGDHGRVLQAWLPIAALEQVAAATSVRFVRRPATLTALEGQLTTEGLAPANAPAWHAAGDRGAGVKIGIIDVGFLGYQNLLGSDLPAAVTVKNFVDGESDIQVDGGDIHGTACAEIVYDTAPQAPLYLAKIATTVDLEEAANWMISQGVRVISTSLGTHDGPGDGSGHVADIVAQSRAAGVLWVTAAGNERQNHWAGPFSDPDGSTLHNWNGAQEINYFGPGNGNAYLIPAGQILQGFLRWDDWTAVNQDYALLLLRYESGVWRTVARSQNPQTSQPGQEPLEGLVYQTSGTAAPYGFVILRVSATRPVNLDFFGEGWGRLDEFTPERSLSTPGDASDALTVAAVDVNPPYPQESYSSEGPTNGAGGTPDSGLLKPDLAAYANVSTVSYGSGKFNGTSAATPHVAAAAALVLSANPTYSPAQLQQFLEQRAGDLGAAGKDTQFGAGRLFLGDPPIPPAAGHLQLGDATATVSEGTQYAEIAVTRLDGSAGAVSVTCATVAGGTATADADYTPISARISFAAGDSVPKPCRVPIVDDSVVEGEETVQIALSDPSGGATIGDTSAAEVHIVDNDLPTLTIDDVRVTEGASGTSQASFVVQLSAAGPQPVSVVYQTVDGTALAASDYQPVGPTTITFAPGEMAKTIAVLVDGDTLDEADETFAVELSGAVGVTIASARGTATIVNDDDPTISISNVAQAEGNTGTTPFTFQVRLSGATNEPVTVRYTTADGSATAPADYQPIDPAGVLTFSPGGALEQDITVHIVGDTVDEPDETFFVNLSESTHATIVQGQGTIINDDSQVPALYVDDSSVVEGTGGTTEARFTVHLTASSSQPVSVLYQTRDGTATAPADYQPILPANLTFAPGETTKTVAVLITGDALDEPDETFTLELSSASGATIAKDSGLGTILDDDPPPNLSIDDVRVTEGNSGTRDAVFTVRQSAASGRIITVAYATGDASVAIVGVATPGDDYNTRSGTLTFAPGSTTQTIAIRVIGDTHAEPDETFAVTLASPTNATIAKASGTGTIVNDDQTTYRVSLPLIMKTPDSDTLLREDFEGSFPGAWQVSDRWPGSGEYTWSARDCRVASGAHSGWAIGGGTNGARLPCGSGYPNDAESWMVAGPFDLTGAAAANLSFKLWLNSELDYDGICRMASLDGHDFYGTCTSGSTGGWENKTLDLADVPELGSLLGRPRVWIALAFSSDESFSLPEGAYVDDIVLSKHGSPAGRTTTPPAQAQPAASGDAQVETPTHRVFTR